MASRKADGSLVDKVLSATRRRILNGEYPPGTRLRIHTLAAASNVSPIPVREALRLLEAERLVESIPNKGPVVAGLSIDDLNDLYAVRLQLEPAAIASNKPLDPDEAAGLVALLEEMETHRVAGRSQKVIDLHRRFHFHLYERSESVWLPHMIRMLWHHAERYQLLSLEPRHSEAGIEHRAIVRALETGEIDEAANVLRDHLETTRLVLAASFVSAAVPAPAS